MSEQQKERGVTLSYVDCFIYGRPDSKTCHHAPRMIWPPEGPAPLIGLRKYRVCELEATNVSRPRCTNLYIADGRLIRGWFDCHNFELIGLIWLILPWSTNSEVLVSSRLACRAGLFDRVLELCCLSEDRATLAIKYFIRRTLPPGQYGIPQPNAGLGITAPPTLPQQYCAQDRYHDNFLFATFLFSFICIILIYQQNIKTL